MAASRHHRRILLLGPTGVDKAKAAERLISRANDKLAHDIKFVDFENEFLKDVLAPPKNWTSYLAQDANTQANLWKQGWDSFVPNLTEETTILGLHATYVSGTFGLRCPINIPKVCEQFRPTLIITLIDDVQSMWQRTERRAGGIGSRGRPSLEELISARRAEQILGDIILTHSGERSPRHVVVAAGNCLDALLNLILFDAGVTYLSFPISIPREMEICGDRSFIDIINEAHYKSRIEMEKNRKRSFISPLAIDELPLLGKISSECQTLNFDCALDRWNASELWGGDAETILEPLSGAFEFPTSLVEGAEAMIRTDVGWRDRRLVLQSELLAIVCPKPPLEQRITRGVSEEIATAVGQGIPCNFWQKPEWDEENFLASRFPQAGSMGVGQTELLVRRFDSLDALISAKA